MSKDNLNVNKNVFCNSPWFELHIYWNGDYGFCCQQTNPPYMEKIEGAFEGVPNNPYNIKRMSIQDWHNSEPMQKSRQKMFGDDRWNLCVGCWNQEEYTDTSRRHRDNQKSVIFRSHFEESFAQSPHYNTFKQIKTDQMPVDIHIDLGNYCNLACKMCWAGASSKIAVQEQKWGILKDPRWLGDDWTKDDAVWDRFLAEFTTLPVRNIHFMGGETLIQPRFEQMIDHMIYTGQSEKVSMSYVTNGTKFNQRIAEKFTFFRSVNVEVSIETVHQSNEYIRQGTDNQTVIDHIHQYQKYSDIVTIRPTISALSLRDFHTLLDFCLKHRLVLKPLVLDNPRYLAPTVIPREIRQTWKAPYERLLSDKYQFLDINDSHADNVDNIVQMYVRTALKLCDADTDAGIQELIAHCERWDQVYNLNAREVYPELHAY